MEFYRLDMIPEQPLDEEDYNRYIFTRKKKNYGDPYKAEELGYSYEWPEDDEDEY